jgi:hypothetical protein
LQARIIIVSKSSEFQGVAGLELFDGHPARHETNINGATFINPVRPRVELKPQPEAWIHMA